MRILLILGLCLAAAPAAAAEDFVARFNAATQARAAGDHAAMERHLRAALEQRPGHPTAAYNLAAALALQGKSRDAVAQLRVLARMGLSFEPAKDADGDFSRLRDDADFKDVNDDFARNRRRVGRPETAFKLLDPEFIPEGIAFDEDRKHFYVGSVHHRRIQRVSRSGEELAFVQPGASGLWAPLGMAADAPRRLLWVATAAIPQMRNAEPAELGKGAVIAFDLDTAQVKRRMPMKDLPGEHLPGDLVVLRNGTIYVTDSKAGALYALDSSSGKYQALTQPGQLASPQGLAVTRNKKVLYVADYTQGLFRYDIEERRLERLAVAPEVCVYGIDGLYEYEGDLIAVQNGVRPHRVVRLTLGDRGRKVRRAEVLAANLPEFDEPTLGVIVGNRFYFIANSQWHRFDKDHRLPPRKELRRPVVLRLALDDGRVDDDRVRGEPREPVQPPQGVLPPLPRISR